MKGKFRIQVAHLGAFLVATFGLYLVVSRAQLPYEWTRKDVSSSRDTLACVDIVLSHYSEDIDNLFARVAKLGDIHALNCLNKVYLYTKTESEEFLEKMKQIEAEEKHIVVKHLPNIGRESHTYLWHIVANYNFLSDVTIFLQDEIEQYDSVAKRIQHITVSTGAMNLGGAGECSCSGIDCITMYGLLVNFRDLYHVISGKLCQGERLHIFGRGQFAASRRRIRTHPKEFYQMLLQMFPGPEFNGGVKFAEDSAFLDEEIAARYLNPSEPLYSHVIERGWSLILDCYSQELQYDCGNETQVECTEGENGKELCTACAQCIDRE